MKMNQTNKFRLPPWGEEHGYKKQTKFFDHSHSGEQGQFHSAGINCAGPGWESDGERLGQQYAESGYNVKKGVIAMELTDDAKDASRQTSEQEIKFHIIGVVLAQQYNLRKGLELFGDRAEAAVDAELSQMHSLKAFIPKFAKDFSYEQKN